jgi:hypothetical protein
MKLSIFNDVVLELITTERITQEIVESEEFKKLNPEIIVNTGDIHVIKFSDELDHIERSLLEDDICEYIERIFNRLVEDGELTDDDIARLTYDMHDISDVEEVFDNKKDEYRSRYIRISIESNIMKYKIKS